DRLHHADRDDDSRRAASHARAAPEIPGSWPRAGKGGSAPAGPQNHHRLRLCCAHPAADFHFGGVDYLAAPELAQHRFTCLHTSANSLRFVRFLRGSMTITYGGELLIKVPIWRFAPCPLSFSGCSLLPPRCCSARCSRPGVSARSGRTPSRS